MADDLNPMGDAASHRNRGPRSTRKSTFRLAEPLEGRPVLSTSLAGWSWQRATEVAVVVCLSIIGSIALPLAIQGAAWIFPRMIRLFLR
jgi:hypothetical protein